MNSLIIALVAGVLALLFALITARRVIAEDEGNDTMRAIAKAIQEGAAAFLRREYTFLAFFVVVVFIVLAVFIDYDILNRFPDLQGNFTGLPRTAISYLIGAISSAGAGYVGMFVAVRANVRTANKAREGLNPALRVAFSSGSVMGMTVVGLSLFFITLLYLIWQDVQPLTGFAFGASSIALFARVGGGIYTKAADVGADLVGKVEAGIPEDDPRNPATIADNVGDNVGDVAGMGADLFESYTGSIVAAMSLATLAIISAGQNAVFANSAIEKYTSNAFTLPLLVMGIGIIASIIGSLLVRTGEDAIDGASAVGAAHRHLLRRRPDPGRDRRGDPDAQPRLQALLGGGGRPRLRPGHRHGDRVLHGLRVRADPQARRPGTDRRRHARDRRPRARHAVDRDPRRS